MGSLSERLKALKAQQGGAAPQAEAKSDAEAEVATAPAEEERPFLWKQCGKCEKAFAQRGDVCPECGGAIHALAGAPVPGQNGGARGVVPPDAPKDFPSGAPVCGLCVALLTPENSSKLPDGRTVHVGCPKAPAGSSIGVGAPAAAPAAAPPAAPAAAPAEKAKRAKKAPIQITCRDCAQKVSAEQFEVHQTSHGAARTPEGRINNCSMANGEAESNCQICGGVCPDAKIFAEKQKTDASTSLVASGRTSSATLALAKEEQRQNLATGNVAVDLMKQLKASLAGGEMTAEAKEEQRQNFAKGNLAVDRAPDSRRTVSPPAAPPATLAEKIVDNAPDKMTREKPPTTLAEKIEVKAAAKRKSPKVRPTLYVDCAPAKGALVAPVLLEDWLTPIAELAAEVMSVEDYRLIDYKAKGVLAAAVRDSLDTCPAALVIDSRQAGADVALELLVPHAALVIRGWR